MAKIYDLTGKEVKEIELPNVFNFDYRPDIIKKVVLAIQANKRQPYGVDVLAGKRTSAHYHGRRRIRHTMMGREMSRMARSHGSSPAQEMRARFVPQAVSGRRAHPPKVERIWKQKINKKENKVAIKSAIAATINLELVKKRHNVSDIKLPIIIVNDLEKIKKTKELEKIILVLKLKNELERAKNKKVRPGKGKMRGRKYKKRKSFLFVVSKNSGIFDASKNLPGVDACLAEKLNAELLAPGTQAGRLIIWSESAIKKLGEVYG